MANQVISKEGKEQLLLDTTVSGADITTNVVSAARKAHLFFAMYGTPVSAILEVRDNDDTEWTEKETFTENVRKRIVAGNNEQWRVRVADGTTVSGTCRVGFDFV